MSVRPGLNIAYGAAKQPHCTIVKGVSIRLWDDGAGEGPGEDHIISLTSQAGYWAVPPTLQQLCGAINALCPAFTGTVHGGAANYCMAAWLVACTDTQWAPGGSQDFDMATAFIADNPRMMRRVSDNNQ